MYKPLRGCHDLGFQAKWCVLALIQNTVTPFAHYLT